MLGFGSGYTCWPSTLRYDATRGVFVCVYNRGSSHVASDQGVYMRTFDPATLLWSDERAVSLSADAPTGYKEKNGLVITSGGDYLVLVRRTSGLGSDSTSGTWISKSTDGGLTWANMGQLQVGGSASNPYLGSHLFQTSTGRLLLHRTMETGATSIWYASPSDLVNWTSVGGDRSLLPGGAVSTNAPVEGRFFEVGGSIVCIARLRIDAIYSLNMRPCYSVSADDGLTWTPWQLCSPDATEMTNGNLDGIANPDGTYDLYWSSRRNQPDSMSQIWCSNVTGAQLLAGDLGRPFRVFRGAVSRDFGYPGVAQTPDRSLRMLTWYDGDATDTRVYYALMRPYTDSRISGYVAGSHARRITSATRV
nr:exo-alpha-sialidase [uncultured Aquabacterium sp.]